MPVVSSTTLYFFLGPDRARKRERVAILRQELGVDILDYDVLQARGCSAATLAGAIRQQPAASPMRLTVIEDADRLLPACVAVLTDVMSHQPTSAVVLCTDDLNAGASLASLVDEASLESFEWLPVEEAHRWMTGYAARLRKTITPEAVRAITQTLGTDTVALRAVLDQLIAWVGSRAQITLEDLETFLTPTTPASANAFALVNAIAQRDAASAVRAYGDQLAAGKDPLEVLGLIIWQVQRWLMIAQMLQAGCAEQRIEQVSGVKAWQIGRLRTELAGRSMESLRHVLRTCWELDVAAKQGQIPVVRLAVETLVMQLCVREERTSRAGSRPVSSPAFSRVGT